MTPQRTFFGEVTVPSGVLVVVDAGLLGIWEGSREDLPDTVDFRVEGPDAREAGGVFDRSWQPRYWYDIPREKAEEARDRFAAFAKSNGFRAELAEVSGGVPHRQRISFALEHGGGRFGTLEFFGIQTPVVAGVPRDRGMSVYGFRMAEEEFSDRWRWVTLEIDEGETARTKAIATVFVDEARLMFADADAVQDWNLPIEVAAERGIAVEESREREGWTFAGDFRPHSHHYEVLKEMRATETGAGVIEVGGAKMCAFFTSWGDGAFPVLADFDSSDALLRLRIDLGSDGTITRLGETVSTGSTDAPVTGC